MSKFICLILVIFLAVSILNVPVTAISEIKDPASVSELNVEIIQTGKIIVSNGVLDWANINLTAPQKTKTQNTVTTTPVIINELGNQLYNLYLENPPTPITYSIKTKVTVKSQRTTYIPKTYTIPKDVLVYLEPTDAIQSEDAKIKALADSIILDSVDDFEKIARLSGWVTENVEYDLAYGTKAYDAKWVYENKIGTCDEFATLYIAMARSLGFPSRYLSGWAYGDNGWEPHAYAESYIGVWVPVDPTWNEVGHLDAVHLQFSVQKSNEVANNVRVSGIKVGTISWVEDNTELTITDFKEEEKEEIYDMIKSAEILEAGDNAVVILKFTPDEYKVLRVSLLPCAGQYNLATIDETVKDVILRPGKETVVYWVVNINQNLPENYKFSCPLTLNSRLLTIKTIDLSVDTIKKTEKTNANVEVDILSPKLTLGNTQTISVRISDATGGDVIYTGVVTSNDILEQTTIGNGRMDFTFTPIISGKNKIVVYTSTGFVKTVEFYVSQVGDVFIDNIEIPETLLVGEKTNATITIKNNRQTSQIVKLTSLIDGEESIETVSVFITKTVSVPVLFLETGIKKAEFTLYINELEQTVAKQVEVYDLPEITLETVYDYNTDEGILLFNVSGYTAYNISLDFSGEKINVGDVFGQKKMRVTSALGSYTATISYADASGKKYVFNKDIVFESENIIQKILRAIKEFIGSIDVI
ncbi:hypothetical protein GQ473_00985 [archaeon]|nr:hypothetical protein [archaeon]